MRKLAVLAALVTMAVAALTMSATASAAPKTATATNLTQQITQTVGGFNIAGVATIDQFVNQNGQLGALLDFVGTATPVGGGAALPINLNDVFVPLAGAANTGGCQILDLTLGPLDLDLLGLVVHLDTVHLNITAQPGPGNLLGNLLCGIAGALDGGGGGGLANLLNRLLGL